ncbi:hypothetical protein EVAR_101397_1 [Eumeta japonica]|uniref:Uncharacterized protein n=1 Tax=Eumeta variegata TaxID=151549 RepID=A0A4C1TIA9_EUMVA|nr:hypothetical protein EVAR_101397_1 [Eumeta japonica]
MAGERPNGAHKLTVTNKWTDADHKAIVSIECNTSIMQIATVAAPANVAIHRRNCFARYGGNRHVVVTLTSPHLERPVTVKTP